MSNDTMDFLDDVAPAAAPVPEAVEPEANVSTDEPAPETVELSPAERVKQAQAAVDAANANLKAAQKLLAEAIKNAEVEEREIPLHVRNAEARAIDQANRDRHQEALQKIAESGVDVNRLIADLGRPRQRKPIPPLFKP